MKGTNITYIYPEFSYGYLRVYDKDGKEHRMSTDTLLKIIHSSKFKVEQKKVYPHLKVDNG